MIDRIRVAHWLTILLLGGCATTALQLPESECPAATELGDRVQCVDAVTDLTVMERAIEDYAARHPRHKLLVVFDIDDTLLTSTQFFGGDAWYRWQSGDAMRSPQGQLISISEDEVLECIFSKLNVLFELARFQPTQADAREIVGRLQRNHSVVALTSRSPGARSGTQRELGRAQIDLASSHMMSPGHSLDYDLRGRGVSYSNGIIMSTGLDKGVVLDDILEKTAKRGTFDAIFMIDDGASNLDAVNAYWKHNAVDVRLFHYTRISKTVSRQERNEANRANGQLNLFLKSAYPDRWRAFGSDDCN